MFIFVIFPGDCVIFSHNKLIFCLSGVFPKMESVESRGKTPF